MPQSSYRQKDALRGLVDASKFQRVVTGFCAEIRSVLRAVWRSAALAVLMMALILGSFVLKVLSYLNVPRIEALKPDGVRLFCRIVLRLIDARVVDPGGPETWSNRGSVIVANHVSYLDAVILNAYFTATFVTSEEIRASGLLGWLTSSAGCFFVERRRKMRLRQDLADLTRVLTNGGRVMFFPEGTTGTGHDLLPMKSSLFEAAMRSGSTVYVYALSYSNDGIAWYGDMTFFPHLWRLLRERTTICNLRFAGSIKPMLSGGRKVIARDVVTLIEKNRS